MCLHPLTIPMLFFICAALMAVLWVLYRLSVLGVGRGCNLPPLDLKDVTLTDIYPLTSQARDAVPAATLPPYRSQGL
jgi:hypothetical protein